MIENICAKFHDVTVSSSKVIELLILLSIYTYRLTFISLYLVRYNVPLGNNGIL